MTHTQSLSLSLSKLVLILIFILITIFKQGELLNGKKVAVKNLRSIPQCHEPQFQKELNNLMKVRHKNIVRFVGYCCETQKLYEKFNGKNILAESTKMLLCFEYMPSGSLQRYISGMSILLSPMDFVYDTHAFQYTETEHVFGIEHEVG